jgi:hypothetical protein
LEVHIFFLLSSPVANLLTQSEGNSTLATYLKAAIHDTKAYRDAKGYRKIPIGYSDKYQKEAPFLVRDYLTCGKKASDSADFWAISLNDWPSECSQSDFDPESLINTAALANVPVFVSQLSKSCSSSLFFALFGTMADNAWSGAVYNGWLLGAHDDEGMVNYGSTMKHTLEIGVYSTPPLEPKTSINIGKPTPVSDAWSIISQKWSRAAHYTGVKAKEFEPRATTPPCPTSSAPWNIAGDVKLPTLIEDTKPVATAKPTRNGVGLLMVDQGRFYSLLAGLIGFGFW